MTWNQLSFVLRGVPTLLLLHLYVSFNAYVMRSGVVGVTRLLGTRTVRSKRGIVGDIAVGCTKLILS